MAMGEAGQVATIIDVAANTVAKVQSAVPVNADQGLAAWFAASMATDVLTTPVQTTSETTKKRVARLLDTASASVESRCGILFIAPVQQDMGAG